MLQKEILGLEVTDALFLFGILLVFLLISYVIIQAIIRKNTIRTQIRLEEIENEKMKMNMLFKKKMQEELKDAGLFLTKEEMDHVDSIKLDNSILSRKILYKMTEMEHKSKRLELGVKKDRFDKKLEMVGEYEKILFK